MLFSQMEHLKCLLDAYLPPTILQPTYLPSHPPTYLDVQPTYLPTHLPIYILPTYLSTYLHISNVPIHPLRCTNLFAYLPTHPPNYHVLKNAYLVD
jgi:hypothetical protein